MIAAAAETARQAATGGDLPVAAVYLAVIGVVFLVAGGIFDFLEWLDTRRHRRAGLTSEQLSRRGALPFPLELGSWEDLGAPANVDHAGRAYKIGIDVHTRACTPTDCVCPGVPEKAGR